MGKPTFAYLLLKEHPYGREMLKQLISEGFIPSIIITEDSKIADEEREKLKADAIRYLSLYPLTAKVVAIGRDDSI